MKAVFFDIDGTFLDHVSGKVLESTWKACKALKEKGYKVALCTGRPKALTQKWDEFPFDGFIGNTGAYIEDEKGEIIYQDFFEAHSVEKIYAIAKEQGIFVQSLGDPSFINREPNEKELEVYENFHLGVPQIIKYDGRKLIHLNIFGEPERLMDIFKEVEDVRMFKTSSYSVDFSKPHVSKASAIEKLMRHWGYEDTQDYVAFGDSMNDIEMLQHAKIGIAMGNGDKDIFPYADKVCGPSNEDSIYQTLIEIGIL